MDPVRLLVGPQPGPQPGPVDEAAIRAVYAPARLPWLRANMVSSVDGAVHGESADSASVNNEVDTWVFKILRSMCDLILVGAGTARADRYGPVAKPICVVSRSGSLPDTLRGGRPGAVLMATVSTAPGLAEARSLLGAEHVYECGRTVLEPAELVARLTAEGFRHVLCEGGPSLLGDLLAAGVVDELCATVTPRLLSGTAGRIVHGPPLDVPLRLGSLLESEGTLLGRWLVTRPAEGAPPLPG